jgi:hypothetical protein
LSKNNKKREPEYKIIVNYAEPDENGYVPTLDDLMNSDRFKAIAKKILLQIIQEEQKQSKSVD